jgi:hypothetical protein
MTTEQKIATMKEILTGVVTVEADENTARTTSGTIALNDWFTAPPIRIPNPTGEGYFRTAIDMFRSPEKTVKLHYWHGGDELEQPHNHPWKDDDGVSFRSTILVGGYTETVYWVNGDGDVQSEVKEYRAGDTNTSFYSDYHVVSNVLPGTITFMVCGKQVPNNEWGYLDIETGGYTKAEKTADFTAKFMAVNSHLVKK